MVSFHIKDMKYKLKKYYDKRWKKVCLILLGLLILNSLVFLFTGKNYALGGVKKVFYTVGIYTEEVRNVEVTSSGFLSKEDGSLRIVKEAKWVDLNTAEINITLESNIKEKVSTKKDIVVLMNANSSLAGEKKKSLKDAFSSLLDYTLKSENNRISLITFNNQAVVHSGFTHSKEEFLTAFDNIELNDKRSFKVGLNALRTFLSDYEKTDKELIVLFIIDGYANLDTSNYLLEYKLLKEEHPEIRVQGITYDVGDILKTGIQEISDSQYYAENSNFEEILFEAVVDSMSYEKLEITDLIHNEYFYLESEDDVSSTLGDVTLTEENGATKVIWNMDGVKTGQKESLTLRVKTKGEKQNEVGFFPTNKKEEATYKIEEEDIKKLTSSLTPVLKNGYVLTYDVNAPKECNLQEIRSENYNAFEIVRKRNDELSCVGYDFKGWEIEEEVTHINDDTFIMPSQNITIRGIWTKSNILKSMEIAHIKESIKQIEYEDILLNQLFITKQI